MLLGKACLHGLVSEEHLFQRLGNDSSFKSITSIIPEEGPLEYSRQIGNWLFSSQELPRDNAENEFLLFHLPPWIKTLEKIWSVFENGASFRTRKHQFRWKNFGQPKRPWGNIFMIYPVLRLNCLQFLFISVRNRTVIEALVPNKEFWIHGWLPSPFSKNNLPHV